MESLNCFEEEYEIDHLQDFDELSDFYTGKKEMDDFIHGPLKDCDDSHYCRVFAVRLKSREATPKLKSKIVAIFALAFDSIDIDSDDFFDMSIGAAGTEYPVVNSSFREQFEQKKTFPALEIAYLAVEQSCQGRHIGSALVDEIANSARTQKIAGCIFLTVRAWHVSDNSAVDFYLKNHFAKLTPAPLEDVWPMYKTIWCISDEIE